MDRRHRGSGLMAGEGEERAEDCEGLASPLGEPDAAEPIVVTKGNKI